MEAYKKLALMQVYILALCSTLFIFSCNDDFHSKELNANEQNPPMTRAVPTPSLDWENLDWMPTPAGQSRIPSPWVGQGSLASTYGIEIINDHKISDGWELLYNSFDADAPGPLTNPYFILYNKYRGIMRIYIYITTEFISTSTYLQDGISIVSNHKTVLLNFLGTDYLDNINTNISNYQQIQPIPLDGSAPLASNKWYMMEYELAYDPQFTNIPYNEIQLKWNLNYVDVTQFRFSGEAKGTLNAIMGSSSNNNIISSAATIGTKTGMGVMAGIGKEFINNNTINTETGENKLGISNNLFKSLSKSINGALNSNISQIPKAVLGLLSAVIGRATQKERPINYSLNATISFTGTGTSSGSFPGTPISFWIPGTNISQNAVGYIPLYNQSLGIFYLKKTPIIQLNGDWTTYCIEYNGYDEPMYWISTIYIPKTIDDYSQYLSINPEVLKIANVEVIKQDLVVNNYKVPYIIEPGERLTTTSDDVAYSLGIRFTIKVTPKDGNPPSILIKTFKLNEETNWTYESRYI